MLGQSEEPEGLATLVRLVPVSDDPWRIRKDFAIGYDCTFWLRSIDDSQDGARGFSPATVRT